MIDERLTTVSAAAALRSSGKNSKDGRKVIDQIAATMILEQALATEKNSGMQPGVSLEDLNV
jgi:putative Holliday junction resolvase